MLAEAERVQAEFNTWTQGVLAGTVRLAGAELAAYRDGWRAGRLRLAAEDRAAVASPFQSPREIVAWGKGYGEGRAGSKATPASLAAHEARVTALLNH